MKLSSIGAHARLLLECPSPESKPDEAMELQQPNILSCMQLSRSPVQNVSPGHSVLVIRRFWGQPWYTYLLLPQVSFFKHGASGRGRHGSLFLLGLTPLQFIVLDFCYHFSLCLALFWYWKQEQIQIARTSGGPEEGKGCRCPGCWVGGDGDAFPPTTEKERPLTVPKGCPPLWEGASGASEHAWSLRDMASAISSWSNQAYSEGLPSWRGGGPFGAARGCGGQGRHLLGGCSPEGVPLGDNPSRIDPGQSGKMK